MTSIGNIEIQDLFVGSANAVGLYQGAVEVWSKDTPQPTSPRTRVKYTAASGLPDWEGDIVGEITGGDETPTTQIPNVGYVQELSIGSHVTSITQSAFIYCDNITSVTIPNGVTSIGSNVFQGCTGISAITIPDSVTSIGGSAFYGCSYLTSVTIPDSVTSIEEAAFGWCYGLTSLTIPASVTSIGSMAFEGSGLTSVTFSGKTMATVQGMSSYSYWELPTGCVLHCTDGDITL